MTYHRIYLIVNGFCFFRNRNNDFLINRLVFLYLILAVFSDDNISSNIRRIFAYFQV